MRTAPFAFALLAAMNIALQAPLARAQGVQPVPYNTSQPLPASQPMSAPPPAPAPGRPPGNDVVILKGGGMLRGKLLEVIPNDHATISLATGQNAIVQWSRIDRIEQQQQQAAPNVMVQPGGLGAPAPAASPMAMVHIETDKEVVLEGKPQMGGWTVICQAPCDTQVPLDYEYRISGSSIRRSKPFSIQANPGQRVTLVVNPASKGAFIGGLVLTGVGPVVIIVGLFTALVGALEQTTTYDSFGNPSTVNNGQSTETTGWIISLVGVGMLVTGIILFSSNSKTKATQEVASADRPSRDDAWLRLPTWHEGASVEKSLPKAATVPIFSRSF